MKKIFAILLLAATVFTLASCSLIRKANPDASKPVETAAPASDNTAEADSTADTAEQNTPDIPVRYTEDQASEVLSHSLTEKNVKNAEIERTGTLIADNSGTEYYVFSVAVPKKAETTKDGATKEAGMEDAVPYYVSVNGIVRTEIESGDNVDTKYVEKAFTTKYGEKDANSGNTYKLVYEGIYKTKDRLCYNYAVYEVAGTKDVYSFNFLVTLDGGFSATTKIDH